MDDAESLAKTWQFQFVINTKGDWHFKCGVIKCVIIMLNRSWLKAKIWSLSFFRTVQVNELPNSLFAFPCKNRASKMRVVKGAFIPVLLQHLKYSFGISFLSVSLVHKYALLLQGKFGSGTLSCQKKKKNAHSSLFF